MYVRLVSIPFLFAVFGGILIGVMNPRSGVPSCVRARIHKYQVKRDDECTLRDWRPAGVAVLEVFVNGRYIAWTCANRAVGDRDRFLPRRARSSV